MDDIIERVARAMCDGNWDAANSNETMNGEEPEDQRAYWMDRARAAIEALREPTKAMLAAVALRDWTSEKDMDWSDGWRVMIDAVLAPLP